MAPKKAGRIRRKVTKSKSFLPSSQDDDEDEEPYDIMDYLFY